MKLRRPGFRSANVEDRRGSGGAAGGSFGGGGFPIPMGKGAGIGGIILALIVAVIGGTFAVNQGGGGTSFPVDNTIPGGSAVEQPAQGLPAEADPDADLFDF